MTASLDTLVRARQERASRALADAAGPRTALVLIWCGEPIGRPGGHDQTYPFEPHPEYLWSTGSRRPGGVMVWDGATGDWTHFSRPVTEAERLWEGVREEPAGEDIAGLARWLGERDASLCLSLGAPSESDLELLHTVVAGVEEAEPDLAERLQQALDRARRPKDEHELELIARAVRATAAGHRRALEVLRPGISEREIQVELEAEMFRQGADATGYGTIVGFGDHAAVLHVSPGDRRAVDGELVLIDAGGSVAGYTADVTRTHAVSGQPDGAQRAVHGLVVAALDAGIAACRPGIEWHDVHRLAARVLAAGLVDLGVLRGEVDGLLESEAIALFFPHGIGHMVGLGVRDVGGAAPGREERRCCGVRVRVDLPLAAGFVMTVEPGIYFVPAILDDPARRERFAGQVDWERVEELRGVGGVRMEDNVLITADGAENLTAEIPR
ncbi:MAG TPA: M24B family metallopeptidase [Thermoanaerobaculia bacterium]|nr:M24B family metallopeptidase [Thermoanaerobaculia bacterium]